MTREHFDLVVIGAGSAGYAAARTARDLGAEVALVEHGPLGGLCILNGCMPSKALLASAEAAQLVREAPLLGIQTQPPQPNIPAIIRRKRGLIAEFADYRIGQLEQYPIFKGDAVFLSPHCIRVGEHELEARIFIIATGSISAPPSIHGIAQTGYLNSDELLDLETLPVSVIVLGGGYVATELGQYLHRVGVDTTLLFRAAHPLSGEDPEIGETLAAALRDEGMRLEAGVQFERAELTSNGQKRIVFKREGQEYAVAADEILSCLGRLPNCAKLDLDNAAVRWHAITGIEVNAYLQTSQPHIYAVGDVTGLYPLVHVAIYQAEVAAKHAFGQTAAPANYDLYKAHTVFTEPQIAVVGETERSLQTAGRVYDGASYPYADHGKAMTIARTAGFVKMLADPQDGKILGAAIVGAEASELIHEMIVAMHFGATVFDFVRIPHLHPTLAEIWTYPAEELADRLLSKRGETAKTTQ